jgi:arabinofuranosyltransferase
MVITAVGLTALAHAAAFAYAWPYVMDDAYITFRYARHLGEGLGPYWNVGGTPRPVEGFSSFLHMFLLGGLHAVTTVDVIVLGKIVGLACSLAALAFLAREAHRQGLSAGGTWLVVAPFWFPPIVMASASGMETTLYVLIACVTPFACLRVLASRDGTGRALAIFVLLALLGTLTRPEYALNAAGLFALVAWRRPDLRRGLALTTLVLFVLPGLAVTGWRLLTYGDILPNTFYVKQRLPGLWGAGYVWRFVLICASPFLLLVIPEVRRLWKEQRDLLLVMLISIGLPCLYFTSVRPLMGWWYRFLIPQLPLLALLAATAVSTRSAATAAPGLRWWRRLAVAVFVLLAVAQIPPIVNFIPVRHADDDRLAEVGRRLRPLAAPGRSLSYYDVGRLPYEAEWTAVDVVGLATSRKDLKGDCSNYTDVLLRSLSSSPPSPPWEIENPCTKYYDPLVDLEFFVEEPQLSRRMRVFVRRDITYLPELRHALTAGWPEPFRHRGGWLNSYDAVTGGWFGN